MFAIQVPSTFNLQIRLLAKSHPTRVLEIHHCTKLAIFLQDPQMPLIIKEPATWKLRGDEIMSQSSKDPLVLPLC